MKGRALGVAYATCGAALMLGLTWQPLPPCVDYSQHLALASQTRDLLAAGHRERPRTHPDHRRGRVLAQALAALARTARVVDAGGDGGLRDGAARPFGLLVPFPAGRVCGLALAARGRAGFDADADYARYFDHVLARTADSDPAHDPKSTLFGETAPEGSPGDAVTVAHHGRFWLYRYSFQEE
jgi:hypothetical protein